MRFDGHFMAGEAGKKSNSSCDSCDFAQVWHGRRRFRFSTGTSRSEFLLLVLERCGNTPHLLKLGTYEE